MGGAEPQDRGERRSEAGIGFRPEGNRNETDQDNQNEARRGVANARGAEKKRPDPHDGPLSQAKRKPDCHRWVWSETSDASKVLPAKRLDHRK